MAFTDDLEDIQSFALNGASARLPFDALQPGRARIGRLGLTLRCTVLQANHRVRSSR
jgi:hypothetical protein